MKETLLPHLVCPASGQPLTLAGEDRQGGEITGGVLIAGDRKYPILDGVPCFLTAEQQIQAKQGFTPMWRYRQDGKFEKRTIYGIPPERKAEWVVKKYASPVAAGEWMLDAGCGSAEMTHALA